MTTPIELAAPTLRCAFCGSSRHTLAACTLNGAESYRREFPPASPDIGTAPETTPTMAEILDSFDARDWARHWAQIIAANPSIPTDEGTMIGWFANALMRGWDEHARRYPEPPAASPDLREPAADAPDDTQRLDWWFAHGMEDSVCEGSVDLWWIDEDSEVERVTHGVSVRDALDKAMRGIHEPDAEG